jgi:hypothetical protein
MSDQPHALVIPREGPRYPLSWRLSGPQGQSGHFQEDKISSLFWDSNHSPSSPLPSHYTNYSILAVSSIFLKLCNILVV